MKKAILALIALMASGCSVYRAYEGPARPEESIGVIDVGSAFMNEANIHLVDGKSRGFGLIDRYELPPGEHELTVDLSAPGYEGDLVVTYFEVEAGKQYTIEAVKDIQTAEGIFGLKVFAGGRWYVLIRDKETRQIVNYVSRKKPVSTQPAS